MEPLAIVGIGCRFPGGARDAASFWELMCGGTDAICDVPPDRWDVRRFHDPDPKAPGKMYTRQAGFLREPIWQFDAGFFGISPREAEIMDPQQRLLLEVAWEALEDAGLPADGPHAARTGVYVGAFCFDNAVQQMGVLSRDAIMSHTATSASMVMLSNRISYALDLRGSSLTVDTACSSSLVAVHLACRALWDGECSVALAGGVNVMLRPESTILECKGGFLSPDARCKAFDESANGYVRGEGAGMIALRPLAAAQAAGDRIYAVICATGSNQDGKTPGITVPNRDSQERLIREVWSAAGVSPAALHYVEAHGTGTQVGDPIELEALGSVLSGGRAPGDQVWVGSVKTNIGHLEAGAGVAGVIKAALVLHHRRVPPNLHFRRPNPKVDLDALRVRVPAAVQELPGEGALHAAVNSFGYGGTNAHAVLRSAPAPAPGARPEETGAPRPFPLSARDPGALAALAERTAAALDGARPPLEDLGHTLGVRRAHHGHRLAVRARTMAELVDRLRAFARGEPAPGAIAGRAGGEPRRLAFVYTGMGAQSWGMGAGLYAREPVFRQAVEECDALFREHGLPVAPAFAGALGVKGEVCGEPRHAQPLNLVLQVALTRLWRARGLVPEAVVGHSVGEIAAAWAAGALELRDAVRLTFHRSRLQQALAGHGGMLAVGRSAAECGPHLAPYGERISVAAVNGPASVTLAGEPQALRELAGRLSGRPLKVEVAYHSAQVAPLEADFRAALEGLGQASPAIPLFSTVHGRRVGAGEHGVGYWWRNARDPVLFADAARAMLAEGLDAFLEIGPHAVLSAALAENAHAAGKAITAAASLRRGTDDQDAMVDALGTLWAGGCRVDWRAAYPAGRHVALPAYPWQRAELWSETAASRADRLVPELHPLIHQRAAAPGLAWETEASFTFFPYLRDHRVAGAVVYPAAAYVLSALAAAELADRGRSLEEVELHRALVLEGGATLRLSIDEREGQFTVHSRGRSEGAGWLLHCSGRVTATTLEAAGGRVDLEAVRARCPGRLEAAELYRRLSARGLDYGPAFRAVQRLSRGGREALAALDPSRGLHPVALDAAFQSLIAAVPDDEVPEGVVMIPVRIRQVRQGAPDAGAPAWAHGRLRALGPGSLEGDVTLCDAGGRTVLEVLGLRCQGVADGKAAADEAAGWRYAYRWEDAERPAPGSAPPGRWLVLAERSGRTAGLVGALRDAGASCAVAAPGASFGRDGDLFTVDPGSPGDLRRLAQEAGPLAGVAFAWELDGAGEIGLEATAALLHLCQALTAGPSPAAPRLALLTSGAHAVTGREGALRPGQGAVWGLGRVISSEHHSLKCRRIDLDPAEAPPWPEVVAEVLGGGEEDEVALREGRRLVHRLDRAAQDEAAPVEVTADTPFVLESRTPGVLDGLAYYRTERRRPGRGEVEIQVHSAALNFKDLMKAMRLLPPEYMEKTFIGDFLGMECSGVVLEAGEGVTGYRPGDPVVVIDSRGAFRSFHTVSTGYMAHKPAPLSMDEAPCLIGYVTPYYGLRSVAQLQPGERVLIHSATGGVGLAAIQIARWLGAEILATTGSEEKRQYLKSLGIEHVMDSRSLRFADEVMERTGGKGVDVVLNTLSGEGMRKSLEVLAPYGRFLEIGKKDIMVNARMALAAFDRNLTYSAIDTDLMGAQRPALFRRLIDEVCALMQDGTLKPLPVTAFPARAAQDAFRHMARARHVGKIVVRMNEGKVPVRTHRAAAPRILPDRTYLVTGGLGGFGLALARWLLEQGARHLALVGRSGASSPEAAEAIADLEREGARVRVAKVDVAAASEVKALLAELAQGPAPLAGVFHAAMVLDDGPLGQLDRARLERVLRPKALGAWNLHLLTRELPLEHFVLFSSVSALIGNPGQGSYVAANAFLDALAQARHLEGLPAVSVNFGAVRDAGVLARHPEVQKHLERMGIAALPPGRYLRVLGDVLRGSPAQLAVVDIDWPRWLAANPLAARLPRFQRFASGQGTAAAGDAGQRLRAALQAAPEPDRLRLVQDALCERLSRVMHLPASKIDVQLSLDNMGMDSLMGVELATALKLEMGVELSAMSLMQGQTVAQLAATLLQQIAPPPDVDQMSEAELDRLLVEMLPAAPGSEERRS